MVTCSSIFFFFLYNRGMDQFIEFLRTHYQELIVCLDFLGLVAGVVAAFFVSRFNSLAKKILNKDGIDIDGDGLPDVPKEYKNWLHVCPKCGQIERLGSMTFKEEIKADEKKSKE